MAREFAEGSQEDSGTATQPSEDSHLQPGDFVACMEEKSTVNAPKILLGHVLCVTVNGEVSLLHYKATSANMYKLEQDSWQRYERITSLTPVSVEAVRRLLASDVEKVDSQSYYGRLAILQYLQKVELYTLMRIFLQLCVM